MKLYLDAVGGIAGDMCMAALLDTGIVKQDDFLKEMQKISINKEFEIEIKAMLKGSIGGTHVNVKHEEHHHHRHLADVINIISESDISEVVKSHSIGIFTKLAKSEAKVHQSTLEHVHFHEVGAVDSIVDIIGVCTLLDMMKIEQIYVSSLPISEGFVNTAHGNMPLPAPATLELIRGMKTKFVNCEKETVTPTGAAILAYFGADFTKPSMNIISSGVGCGTMDFDFPNVLRATVFEDNSINGVIEEELFLLSANIDDMTPEDIAYSMEVIREHVLDIDVTSTLMKKGRLAFTINILVEPMNREKVVKLIFKETSTIGIKVQAMSRLSLQRERGTKVLEGESVQTKKVLLNGEVIREKIEFESRAKLARKKGKSILSLEEKVSK